jgi:hypothetical protein
MAIHASAKVPPFQVLADAERDRWAQQHFEREGWRDRDALLALPRSAVVGTVELVRIVRPGDLDFTPGLVGPLEETDWLWEFADPVEIEPVTGVRGKLNLWTLDAAVAQAVTDAEERARASGAHQRAVPRESIEFARARKRLEDNEPFWNQLREWLEEKEQQAEKPPRRSKFRQGWFERLFRRVVSDYYATHQRRGTGAAEEVAVDRRRWELRAIFGDRAWVTRADFEYGLRRALFYEGADVDPVPDPYDDGEGRPQREVWFGRDEFRELENYHEWEGGVGEQIVNPIDDFPKHPGGRPKKRQE